MKCDKAMQRYLEMDNREYLPLMVKLHTLLCRSCRVEIDRLDRELAALRRDAPFPPHVDISVAVMHRVRQSQIEHAVNVGTGKWILVGGAILASIVLVPFSDSLIWLKGQFGGHLEVPFSVILGVVISGYAAIYIATHLEQLKRMQSAINKKLNI